MCRLLAYLGEPTPLGALISDPPHSLLKQSWLAKELVDAKVNADGWGAGVFLPGDSAPCVYVSTQPIWADVNRTHLGRALVSDSLVAAVRSATDPLSVAPANTQPFATEGLLFVHNGYVGGFRSLRRRVLGALSEETLGGMKGVTDSEHLFALILEALGPRRDAGALLQAGARAIGQMSAWCREAGSEGHFSVVLSTQESMVAFRSSTGPTPPSLYLFESPSGSTIISSEPLDGDPGWQPIPPGGAVVARLGAPPERVAIP